MLRQAPPASVLALESRTFFFAGETDLTFGNQGMASAGLGLGDNVLYARHIVAQPDGKVVVGSGINSADGAFALERFNPDGSLDPTFGDHGKVITRVGGSPGTQMIGMSLLDDGTIFVAAGASDFGDESLIMARYRPNGSRDKTFGRRGIVWVATHDVEVATSTMQSDGKILVAGETGGATSLLRFNADGSRDLVFGQHGRIDALKGANAIVRDVKVDAEGRILLTGAIVTDSGAQSTLFLDRHNPNGSVDTSFADHGRLLGSSLSSRLMTAASILFPDRSHMLLVVRLDHSSEGHEDNGLVRLNLDGSLDKTFGARRGLVDTFSGSGVDADPQQGMMQRDGKILVLTGTGQSDSGGSRGQQIQLVRYNPDGSVDTTFGDNPGVRSDLPPGFAEPDSPVGNGVGLGGMTIGPDGSIYVVGMGDDGQLDPEGNGSDSFTDPIVSRLDRDSAPVGMVSTRTLRTGGTHHFHFLIHWRDDNGLDLTTLDSRDLRLIGSNDLRSRISLVAVMPDPDSNGAIATYAIKPIGGAWDPSDDGIYRVKLMPSEVSDLPDDNAGTPVHFTPGGIIGELAVQIEASD